MKITAEELLKRQREFESAMAAFAEDNDGSIPAEVAEGTQRIAKSLVLEDEPQEDDMEETEVEKSLRLENERLQAEIAKLQGKPGPLKNKVSHTEPTTSAVKPVTEEGGNSLLRKALNIANEVAIGDNADRLAQLPVVDVFKLNVLGSKHVNLGSGLSVTQTTRNYLASLNQ